MCVMNAVSYLKGDAAISDFPDCVDPYLARVAQILNDSMCEHRTQRHLDERNLVEDICSKCSHELWLFGAQLMGTAEPWRAYHPTFQLERQWGTWKHLVKAELRRSPLLGAKPTEARSLANKSLDLLERPNDSALAMHIASALQVSYGSGGICSAQRYALQKVHDLCRVAPLPLVHFHPIEPDLRFDRGRELAIDAAYVSFLLTGRTSAPLGKNLLSWAWRQLALWIEHTGYAPDPVTISAPMVEKLERASKVDASV
jgi:hypothetical protein